MRDESIDALAIVAERLQKSEVRLQKLNQSQTQILLQAEVK